MTFKDAEADALAKQIEQTKAKITAAELGQAKLNALRIGLRALVNAHSPEDIIVVLREAFDDQATNSPGALATTNALARCAWPRPSSTASRSSSTITIQRRSDGDENN